MNDIFPRLPCPPSPTSKLMLHEVPRRVQKRDISYVICGRWPFTLLWFPSAWPAAWWTTCDLVLTNQCGNVTVSFLPFYLLQNGSFQYSLPSKISQLYFRLKNGRDILPHTVHSYRSQKSKSLPFCPTQHQGDF